MIQLDPTHLAPGMPNPVIDSLEILARHDGLLLCATKRINAHDLYLRGHFPGFTIFPGVFIIEAVTQATMLGLRESRAIRVALEVVMSVRFLAPLLVNDKMALEITIAKLPSSGPIDLAAVCYRADGVVAAKLRLRFRRESELV